MIKDLDNTPKTLSKMLLQKKASDWVCYLKIENLEYQQARNIETHIKKMKSKIHIQNLKKHPEMQQKLITKYDTGSSR